MIRLEALRDELVNNNYSKLEAISYTATTTIEELNKQVGASEEDTDLVVFYTAYKLIEDAGIDTVTESELQFIQDRVFGLQLDDTVATIYNLL